MRNDLVSTNTTINGAEFGWSNVVIMLNGFPFTNIMAIDYKEVTDYVNLYGRGAVPVTRGAGNHTFEGSLTIRVSDLTAFQTAARNQGFPTGDITCLQPFTIGISYIPSSLGEGITMMEKLLTCQFTQNMRAMTQGATNFEIVLPIVIGGISWGSTQ